MRLFRRQEENEVCLTLSGSVVATLLSYVQAAPGDNEACGVLIGRVSMDGKVCIEAITEPRPQDQRQRNWFRRSSVHQDVVEKLFRKSGRELVYCGEWHTHPEPVPSPSETDLAAWSLKLEGGTCVIDPFFIIVGTKRIRAWEGCQHRLRIWRLLDVTPCSDRSGKETPCVEY